MVKSCGWAHQFNYLSYKFEILVKYITLIRQHSLLIIYIIWLKKKTVLFSFSIKIILLIFTLHNYSHKTTLYLKHS